MAGFRYFAAIFLLMTIGDASSADSERSVSSQSKARIDGKTLTYGVEAGRLPIRDMESGELRGSMFYVAYRVESPKDKLRPVMFSWGGGPSGPAIGVHMWYGPKQASEDGRIVDNPNSLLLAADLVFVDPIGTGFSRAAKSEYLAEFYSTIGDARSVAEFIRVWCALNDVADAPIFLNGQSYGVWRASIVAEMLEIARRRVTGVVLTSGGMGLAGEFTDPASGIAYRVPDFAATALFHGSLPADLGTDPDTVRNRAVSWARDTYAPALGRIDQLSADQRENTAEELARFTGYPLADIDRQTLQFSLPEYRRRFPGEADRILNLFDMRTIRGETVAVSNNARAGAQARYLRSEVGYRTDLAYIGLESGYTPTIAPDYQSIGQRWKYNSGIGEAGRAAAAAAGQGPPGKEPWIRRAIDINPDLRVFVAAGLYDSLNFCSENEDRVRRMPDTLADNFVLRCYPSGHGIYGDALTYPLLTRDIQTFIIDIAY